MNGINLSRAHKLVDFHQSDSKTEARGSIFVIEFPPNIWIRKVKNRYTPPYYAINIDDDVFDLDFTVKQFFSQNRFGKRASRKILSLLEKTYIKRSPEAPARPTGT